MKRRALAGARASAYAVARLMARSSCCFVMFERPLQMLGLVEELLLVRLLRSTPPEELRLREPLDRELPLRELLPDKLRLREPPPERDLLLELRELEEPNA
jgi:hypothetical protein